MAAAALADVQYSLGNPASAAVVAVARLRRTLAVSHHRKLSRSVPVALRQLPKLPETAVARHHSEHWLSPLVAVVAVLIRWLARHRTVVVVAAVSWPQRCPRVVRVGRATVSVAPGTVLQWIRALVVVVARVARLLLPQPAARRAMAVQAWNGPPDQVGTGVVVVAAGQVTEHSVLAVLAVVPQTRQMQPRTQVVVLQDLLATESPTRVALVQ